MSLFCNYCETAGHSTSALSCTKKKLLLNRLDTHLQTYNVSKITNNTVVLDFVNGLDYMDCIVINNFFQDGKLRMNNRRIPISVIRTKIIDMINQRRQFQIQNHIGDCNKRILYSKDGIKGFKTKINEYNTILFTLGITHNDTNIDKMNIIIENLNGANDFIDCPVCYEPTQQRFVTTTNCNHKFCAGCMFEQIDRNNNTFPACPLCRTPIQSIVVCNNFVKKSLLKIIK